MNLTARSHRRLYALDVTSTAGSGQHVPQLPSEDREGGNLCTLPSMLRSTGLGGVLKTHGTRNRMSELGHKLLLSLYSVTVPRMPPRFGQKFTEENQQTQE